MVVSIGLDVCGVKSGLNGVYVAFNSVTNLAKFAQRGQNVKLAS